MAKILVIEDDHHLCSVICDKLGADGNTLESVETGAEACARLKENLYDLLIVDWDLPDCSGVDLCQDFRTAGGTIPILMLTGHNEIADKEAGFNAGADDYLTKPFNLKELAMRVRALLRRAAVSGPGPQAAPGSLYLGQTFSGKYRLEEYIGEGGMALVYRATHTGMNKKVVLKLLHSHLLGSQLERSRFERECQVMARVNHANVGSIYDTGLTDDQRPFLVMEFVDGESLADRLFRSGEMPPPEALEILIQALRGLEAVHNAGIIHRDLKPENILIQKERDRPDRVKIVDFGISHLLDATGRLTADGWLTGSAGYMAPEQLRDEATDCRADLYAMGVILFRLLTNELPFTASSTEAFFVKQLQAEPALLSSRCPQVLPASPVEVIVQKAIARNPVERYQTAPEMRKDIEQALLAYSRSL